MEINKKKKEKRIRIKKKPVTRVATIIPKCNRCGARIVSRRPRSTGTRRGKRLVTAAHYRSIRRESRSPCGVMDPLLCLLSDVNRLRDLLLEALNEMSEEYADAPTSSEYRRSDFYREHRACEFVAPEVHNMDGKGKVWKGKADKKVKMSFQNEETYSEIKSCFNSQGTLMKKNSGLWKGEHDDPFQNYRKMVLESASFPSCDSPLIPKAVLVDMILSWCGDMVHCAPRSSPSSKKEGNQVAVLTPLRQILCESLSALDDARRQYPHNHHFRSPTCLDATNGEGSLLVLPSTASPLPCDDCRCPGLKKIPFPSSVSLLCSSTTLEGAAISPLATLPVECPSSLSGGETTIKKDEQDKGPLSSDIAMKESHYNEIEEHTLPCVQFLGSLSKEQAETLLQQCKFYNKRLKAASNQICHHFQSLCIHPVPSELVRHEKYAAAPSTCGVLQKYEEEEKMEEKKGKNGENDASQGVHAEKAQNSRHANMEKFIPPPSLHGIIRNFNERIQLYDALATCQNSARTSFITFSDALELFVSETLTVFQREKEYWKNIEKARVEYEVLEELRDLLHHFCHALSVCVLQKKKE